MAFETLLGNDRLKDNLTKSLQKGRISHFYLISGPQGSGKHTLAKLLSAAILCQDAKAPCGKCNICRKVMENNHPDVITVDDPEHKAVAVKLVREAREDMYILPNESDHKIYIFPQELGVEGQNALLKILEEPPKYGVFILLSTNAEQLLPTVRSRCTELALTALPESVLTRELSKEFPDATPEALNAAAVRSGGYLGQARTLLEQGAALPPQTEQFLTAFTEKNTLELTKLLASLEKTKRDQLIPLLESWTSLLEEALACRSGIRALHPMTKALAAQRSSQELLQAITHLQKTILYAQSNVSPAAICGYLTWQLK
jgi:DNA polymerase-3 subunit delta'